MSTNREMTWFAGIAAAVLTMGSPAAALAAGSGIQKGETPKEVVEGLQKLHAENQAEMQAGNMAEQRGTKEDVKAFARNVVQDHEKADRKLGALARSRGINLEDEKYRKAQEDARGDLEKLSKKSGVEFDREYISRVADANADEEKALRELAAATDYDGELKAFLKETHATVASHLAHARMSDTEAKKQERDARQARAAAASSTGGGLGAAPPAQRPADAGTGTTPDTAPHAAEPAGSGTSPTP